MATAAALAVAATCSLPASSRLPATARFPLRPSEPPSWIGLKHLGISVRLRYQGHGVRSRGRAVYASLFGVGAPEALVIGVVALLVFGPKGLAEVARTLGKTLRAFQPTIRELQDVSREFKTTLEREIGLDEVQSSLQSTYKPSIPLDEKPTSSIDQNGAQPNNPPYSTEDLLKVTEEQLAASASGIQPQGTDSEGTEVPEASSTPTTLEAVPDAAATLAESTSPSTAQSLTSTDEKVQDQ